MTEDYGTVGAAHPGAPCNLGWQDRSLACAGRMFLDMSAGFELPSPGPMSALPRMQVHDVDHAMIGSSHQTNVGVYPCVATTH